MGAPRSTGDGKRYQIQCSTTQIEEGPPFHARYRLKSLDEEAEIEMADRIQRTVPQAGLERYEISDYARPGHELHHNVNY